MAQLIRAHDWAGTPLGAREYWPGELRFAVDMMLATPLVASVVVGPDRVLLYNDAAAALYGDKHPGALGRPVPETWPDAWAVVQHHYDLVFDGESVQIPAQALDVERPGAGQVFEAYLTPVRDAGGTVIAAYMTGFEVGARLRAEAALTSSVARQTLLLKLGDTIRTISDPETIQRTAMQLLGQHLGLSRTYYFRVEREQGGCVHVIETAYQREPDEPSMVGRHAPANFATEIVEGFTRGEVIAVADVGALAHIAPGELAHYRALGVTAVINVPLLRNGEYSAGIGAHDTRPRAWTQHEIDLIREVAARAAIAVERVQAEAARRESEELLALAFRTLPVGIAIVGADGETVMANDEMRRFLPTGKIPSRDPGRSTRWRGWDGKGEMVRPDNFPGARALRGEAVSPGMQMLYRDDGGAEIWTEVSSAPMRNSDGQINAAITVVIDVNRIKRSEEAARASEERLHQFGEASQDILWVRDADTLQWTYLTPAFEPIYGVSRQAALTGDNYRNWQDLIVPEDRARVVACTNRVSAGERVTFEYRIRRPVDGQIRWLRDTDFPMHDAAGRVTRIGGVGHDVTELKRIEAALRNSEGRLRILMEGVPQLIWRSCADGRWTWASPQWLGYTGQTQEQSHGLGWLDPVHPDDREAASQAWHEARPHGVLNVQFRVRRASDGAWRWHQTRSAPVRGAPGPDGAEGSILEWLGTTTDIEDLKRLQSQQQVLVAELQHRTRNLLAMVRNIARRSIDPSPGREQYDARLSALGRVQGFLSRSTAYAVPLASLVNAELQSAGDGVLDRISADGPAVELPGESVQAVALALHELATNSVKYGALAQSSGRLSVTWHVATGSDGPRLVIDWRESGVAMPDRLPARRGYGTELITQALPYQLGAETALEFTPDGVVCRIVLPAGAFSSATEEKIT